MSDKEEPKREMVISSLRYLISGCASGADLTAMGPLNLPNKWARILRMSSAPKIQVDDFLKAAESGNLDDFKRLYMADTTRIALKDGKGRTAAHQAAARNRVNILRYICDQSGDFNAKDNAGNTPLHIAVECDAYDALDYLLSIPVDTGILNEKKQAPVHLATELNKVKSLRVMGQYRNVIDIQQGGEHGRTALHLAAIYDHEECARILITEFDACPRRPCNNGYYPIHEAAKNASSKTMEVFFQWGEQRGCTREEMISFYDSEGNVPLHSAVHGGDIKAVELCLKSGAKISTQQHDLSTPVHLACAQRIEINIKMEVVLDQIISELLCNDTQRIRLATNNLIKSCEYSDTLPALCRMLWSPREPQVRQLVATLLNKWLWKPCHWQRLPSEQMNGIKRDFYKALIREENVRVRNSMAILIATVMRHEGSTNSDGNALTCEFLNFMLDVCQVDSAYSRQISSIFPIIAERATIHLSSHIDRICGIFTSVLTAADASGDVTTPMILNMASGIVYLMPFVCGQRIAEQSLSKAMPLLLKTVYAFAHKGDGENFATVLDVFDSITQFVPELMNKHLKELIGFCFDKAIEEQIDESVGYQMFEFMQRLVRGMRNFILQQDLHVPMLHGIFDMMCCHTDIDLTEIFISDTYDPMAASSRILDELAKHFPPKELITPLHQLLESSFQSPDHLRLRSVIMCLGVIAEGCCETLNSLYLLDMLNLIIESLSKFKNTASLVRPAAFFALGRFFEHLPDVRNYALEIMPIFIDFLEQLVSELNMGLPEPPQLHSFFFALESVCLNMEVNIVSYLPALFENLFNLLRAPNSRHLHKYSLACVFAVVSAARENVMPFLSGIVEILKVYLVKDCPEDAADLRILAMETLATIIRRIGKENAIPLADGAMNYCLMMLDQGPDDAMIRRCVYDLLGAIATVVEEIMSQVFPKIMTCILASVKLSHIELDSTLEKEAAIGALQEFAANAGRSFTPYLQTFFDCVIPYIEGDPQSIRKVAIRTLCVFVIAYKKQGDGAGATKASATLMPKLAQSICGDKDQDVVIYLLDQLCHLFCEVGHMAMPSQEVGHLFMVCIRDALNKQLACQRQGINYAKKADDVAKVRNMGDEADASGKEAEKESDANSELDQMIIENAAKLMPQLGYALRPQIFSEYFGHLLPYFLRDLNTPRTYSDAFIYDVLASSVRSMAKYAAPYFDTLCQTFIDGASDTEAKAREFSYLGLGELVFYVEKDLSIIFPAICQVLYKAIYNEKNPSALDNVIGAVARVIVRKCNSMALPEILPVFLSNLPLRGDKSEYDYVLMALETLYKQARPALAEHLDQVINVLTLVLVNQEIPDGNSKLKAKILLKKFCNAMSVHSQFNAFEISHF